MSTHSFSRSSFDRRHGSLEGGTVRLGSGVWVSGSWAEETRPDK